MSGPGLPREEDRTCGHRSHRYDDVKGEEGVRLGTRDPYGSYMRYERCPEPPDPGRAPDEPPVGTVVRDADGRLTQRYRRGWGPTPLGDIVPWAQWRPMWEAWGPLTVVSTPAALDEDALRSDALR